MKTLARRTGRIALATGLLTAVTFTVGGIAAAAGCQDSWKWVPAGATGWRVIASDVKDGTDYRFRFLSVGAFQGYRAN